MSVAANLARAMQLDDPYPADVCPGCHQDIKGWDRYSAHRTVSSRSYKGRTAPWPFMDQLAGPGDVCPWTNDYLNARRFRRRYIAQHYRVAS